MSHSTFGGKHERSVEEYHAIPDGWDAESIVSAHAALHGTVDIRPTQIADTSHAWARYRQALYNIAGGVSSDVACVELAVRYIELHYIGSYSGFIRALMARRLKHASLTDKQQERLSGHFLDMLRQEERCQEFGDYLRLWRHVVTPGDLAQVEQLVQDRALQHVDFFLRILSILRSGASPAADADRQARGTNASAP